LESDLNIKLPDSYKEFLRCIRGFWLLGGSVQISEIHPFFHNFPQKEQLTSRQLKLIKIKGGKWPPPSQGMLCFAEFFMEADGDQVLFDVSKGLNDGEYPVFYYSHENNPPLQKIWTLLDIQLGGQQRTASRMTCNHLEMQMMLFTIEQ